MALDPNSPMNAMMNSFMYQMMGMKPPKRPSAGLKPGPVAPPAPLLSSAATSYFKKPQAGLAPPSVSPPSQAGLPTDGGWAARYGVKPKWSKG